MASTRSRIFLTLIGVGAALFIVGAVAAVFVVVRALNALNESSCPELKVPPVEQWAQVPLSIDADLHCPTPVICRGLSHLGPYVAPFVPCCDWQFTVGVTEAREHHVHMSSGDGDEGETFDFILNSNEAGERIRVFGRAFGGQCERPLQGLSGVVIVNTLDWREHATVHVRFELNYYYDDDPANWSRIEVCADAPVTLER